MKSKSKAAVSEEKMCPHSRLKMNWKQDAVFIGRIERCFLLKRGNDNDIIIVIIIIINTNKL